MFDQRQLRIIAIVVVGALVLAAAGLLIELLLH